jgi:hypothetical protein
MDGLQRFTRRGLLGGFLAATAVALWFLVVDLLAGAPLRTPAFLAGALFALPGATVTALPIALYTLLHYALFLALGVAVAWLVTRINARAYVLLGLVTGFLLFDLLFYASIVITGVNVVEALGWPVVLVGNLLAGVVLLESLRMGAPVPGPGWRALLAEHRILREGGVAGLLGASIVALSFLVIDVLFRQPLFTPAALGSALLHGVTVPGAVQVDAATVLAYTALHVVAFLGVGIAAAALLTGAESYPGLIFGFVLVFVTFEVLFLGLLTISAAWILDTLGWWNVLIGNVLATAVMVGYLGREHPALWRMLRKGTIEAPG